MSGLTGDLVPSGATPANDHDVVFYGDDSDLASSVSDFLIAGLRTGHPCLVVATPEHVAAFEKMLWLAGQDVTALKASGLYVEVDAAELLSSFVTPEGLDRALFADSVGGAVSKLSRRGARPFVYGEMVALLWRDGFLDLALELEALWNGLMHHLPISLLCGYPTHSLAEGEPGDLEAVCRLHSHVRPAETLGPDLSSASMELARLQVEIARRDRELGDRDAQQVQAQVELDRLRTLERVHSEASKEAADLPLPETLSVVVVEDNPFDLELIKMQIESDGISAEFVHAWDQGTLAMALAAGPDLLLTDYNLPGLDVMTVLDMAGNSAIDLPVIIVTGYVGNEAATECMKRGAADYVLKDSLARLPQVVRSVMQQKRMRQAAALARAEIFASESLKMAILESALDCVVAADIHGRIIEFNPAAEATFGYQRQEVLGKKISEVIIPPRYVDGHEEALARFRREGHGNMIGRRIEVEAVRKDGTEFPIELALREADLGGVRIFTAVIRDISERRDSEAKVRASESLFRDAFSAARTGISLIAGDGRTYVDVNPALCEMLGYTREELMGLSWVDITHPDDLEWNLEIVDEMVAGGPSVNDVTKRYVRKDGRIISVEITDSLVRDETGNPLYFVSHVIDVTEKEAAAQALRESEQLLQAVINNSPAVIFVKDRQGRYLLANEKLNEAAASPCARILGRTAHDLWPGEFADQFSAQDDEVFVTGATIANEEVLPTSDGSLRTFLTVKFPLFDANGDCNALCGISTDITERAKAATEKEKLITQLKQSQKMEAIGQLAGGVAHDFNNLLAVILNYADFLLEDLDADDPRRGDVLEISKAGDKAAGLVRQLLAFSRKEVIAPRLLDVNEVVADLHQLLRRSIGEDIELMFKAWPGLPTVLADQTQLEQVILNLAVNARDAMPQGGSLVISTGVERLEEGVRPGLSEGDYVRLTVEDTGVGMDQQTAERIFEPFFTTKGQGEGTGLGLSTVYGIVKQADGGVYADSVPGEGTSFHVFLQARTDSEAVERASGYVHFGTAHHRVTTGTVLLVEDEEGVRSLVSRILTASGFQVIEFAAARDALAYCWSGVEKIDLLLTDVVMPDMSGKALSDELHAIRPDIKTLYMSGYTDEIITRRGVLEGGEHLIQKPFKGDEIVARIRSLLDPDAPAA